MSDNFNIDKNNKESQKNSKSFYSVNLTEGRIFVIFVLLVLVFVILFFGIFLLISKINKDNYARNNINSEATNSNTTLNFYDASKNNKDVSNDIENESKIEQKEETIVKEDKKEESPKINLDDSEMLYSSKFKKVENSNSQKNIKKEIVKTTTTTINKNNNISKTSTNKKYVIQVGSYVNKETALEIEDFYKKAGYPTYIQNYTKDKKTYYRLRIGPFKDKKTAENYLISLKQSKYGKNSYISIINI